MSYESAVLRALKYWGTSINCVDGNFRIFDPPPRVFTFFTVFTLSRSIFELNRPILPFWNSQSLIYNIDSFEKYAMNGMTEIKEIMCVLFLLSDSM